MFTTNKIILCLQEYCGGERERERVFVFVCNKLCRMEHHYCIQVRVCLTLLIGIEGHWSSDGGIESHPTHVVVTRHVCSVLRERVCLKLVAGHVRRDRDHHSTRLSPLPQ